MIEKIKFQGIATYKNEIEIYPKKVNYIYGGNGVGKTTLSNILKNLSPNLEFQGNVIKRIVYNKNFVSENFYESQNLKGIFTLGEEQKEIRVGIDELSVKIATNQDNIAKFADTITKLEQTKRNDENKLEELAWSLKIKYYEDFKKVFEGNVGSKKNFLKKIEAEFSKKRNEEALKYLELKKDYETLFLNELIEYDVTEIEKLIDINEKDIKKLLEDPIIGKENSQISEVITKLGNSDWVHKGMAYLTLDKICPFCQQVYERNLKSELENLFDETYLTKIENLSKISKEYKEYYIEKITKISSILKEIKILNLSEINEKLLILKEKIQENQNLIKEKLNSPSMSFKAIPIGEEIEELKIIIEKIKEVIIVNNKLKKEKVIKQNQLVNLIWDYFYIEIKEEFNLLKKTITGKKGGINNISKIKADLIAENIKYKLNQEVLESKISDIQKTKNEINKILLKFGFTNFKLEIYNEKFYKIVRPCGEEALETLSEGEKTFLTFIYFYQLVKGSFEKENQSEQKILVIDDPISSLDSNVIFIVSNLIKALIKDCLNNENSEVKQIFILTHNIYFHKEVTYKGSRDNQTKEERYFTIKKINGQSKITQENKNPIQTTYDLLWDEIRDSENINKVTVFNTMRRILEYYFNIIGGLDYESAEELFDGAEKIIFKSLISWINDGSHCIYDDILISCDEEHISEYLKIFEKTFDVLNHKSHYEMMMKK